MDRILPKLYRDYGLYSNYRNFPLAIDGLKPVERRVLLSAYKIARNKLVKSRQVDAYTIGHYHPHGECITGDTKILLLDGTVRPIKDLTEEKNFWVYSCKTDGQIVPGLAHSARIVKKVTKIYRIILDNNNIVECTDDHLFMLRDGNYIEASKLKVDDSLMPIYLRKEDGYTLYKDNSRKICREEKVAWMVVRNLINEDISNLLGRQKYHTHHKNEKRNDDRPENLEVLFHKDHCRETCLNRSSDINKLIGEKVKKAFLENKNNFREMALEGLRKGREKMFSDDSPIREKIRNKNSMLMTEYNHRYVEDRILKTLKKMLDNNIEINQTNYEIYRTEIYNGPLWKTILRKFGSISEAVEIAKDYNHSVKRIEVINLNTPIEVYDMSVEKYHNFAIDSGIFIHNCYGTIVQLVRQGFLTGQGNFGTTVGVEPVGAAAPRYTECRISELALDMAFKYVKFVPWIDTELDDKEPQFLPTMYPICLMGTDYTQGIGFGFKTYIPCYTVSDLYKRLLWLLKIRKRKPIIAPITDCQIVSDSSVLDELLAVGKAKIEVEGIIEIDPRLNKVKLRSWPPGKRFESFLNKFSKELAENMIGFSDLSVKETEIVFQVMRERNRDKIFKEFVDKLRTAIKGTISFETTVVDENQKVQVMPIDQMLLNTFNRFREVNDLMLINEISDAEASIVEMDTLKIIKPILSTCLKNGYDVDQSLEIIEKQTPISKKDAGEMINKYRIRKLLTLDTDTAQFKTKVIDLTERRENLTTFVLEQYGGK
jgi:hypothetical protein